MALDQVLRIVMKYSDQASAGMRGTESAAASMGQRLSSLGRGLTLGLTLPLLGIAAVGVKSFADLEQQMRNIQSVGKQTDAEMYALMNTFQEMSMNVDITTESDINLAKAFYDIQGAGFFAADAMDVLTASTQLATAGMTDTYTAMDAVTTILNSYQMAASESTAVSDILFTMVDRGKGSLAEFAGSLSNVIPTAAAVGIPLEQIAAAMATLTRNGADAATASTNLNAVISQMLSPSTQLSALMQRAGYDSGMAMIQSLGLAGALEAVANAAGNDAETLNQAFGEIRAFRGIVSLTGGNTQALTADLEAMSNAAGRTAEAYAIQTKSLAEQLKSLRNNVQVALQRIGQDLAPTVGAIAGGLKFLVNAFTQLPAPVRQVIVAVAALLALLGPVLMIVGAMASGWGALVAIGGMLAGVFSTLAGILPVVAAGIAAVGWPVLLVVAAIAALVAAGYLLIKNWDAVKAAATAFAERMQRGFERIGEFIKGFIAKIGGIPSSLEKMFNSIPGFMVKIAIAIAKGLWEGIKKGFGWIADGVKSLVNRIKSALGIGSPATTMIPIGVAMAQGIGVGFNNTVPKMLGGAMGGLGKAILATRYKGFIVQAFQELLSPTDFPRVGKGWENQVKDLMKVLTGEMSPQQLIDQFSAANPNLRNKNRFIAQLKAMADGLLRMKGLFSKAGIELSDALIQSIFSNLGIASPSKVMASVGKNMALGLSSGFSSSLGAAIPALQRGMNSLGTVSPLRVNAMSGGMALSAAGAGGGNTAITIQNLNVPPGTTREQVDAIMAELGKRVRARGANYHIANRN